MKNKEISPIGYLIKTANPWALLTGIILYSLGGGLAHFLGVDIDWVTFWLGFGCITHMQLSSGFLKAFFDTYADTNPKLSASGDNKPIINRTTLLQIIATILTIGAVLTFLLFRNGKIGLPALFVLGIGFLLAFFYGVPPLRFANSGYGELAGAILLTNVAPALAFILQTGELHRLLAMLTFPLTALNLAMHLAQSLEQYYSVLKSGHKNLMVRLGWQRGINVHNLLILSAYILIVVAASLGLPWLLSWPGLLTLPLGLFQIWMMFQITSGAKPRWRLLNLTSISTFFLTAYFITLALWTG